MLRLTPGDSLWPNEFDAIDAPPTELWALGRTELLATGPRIGIVGSRSASPYGIDQARRFARALARAGVSVVSGLARGIDAAAHAGALEAGGATIAVLGSAVDRPWPSGRLTDRVRAEGLLLSEFPPGKGPRRHHFPLRNRLISGLSLAILVVEAAHASGSLITARWAADQGRDVFALPGRVDHPMARGCHRLLREGAGLVESPAELLSELGLAAPSNADRSTAPPLPPEQAAILTALVGETLTADELATRLGRAAGDVLATLVELELSGHVHRAPGGLYRRAER